MSLKNKRSKTWRRCLSNRSSKREKERTKSDSIKNKLSKRKKETSETESENKNKNFKKNTNKKETKLKTSLRKSSKMIKRKLTKFIKKSTDNCKHDRKLWPKNLLKYYPTPFLRRKYQRWNLKLSEKNWPSSHKNLSKKLTNKNPWMQSKSKSSNLHIVRVWNNYNKSLLLNHFYYNQTKSWNI